MIQITKIIAEKIRQWFTNKGKHKVKRKPNEVKWRRWEHSAQPTSKKTQPHFSHSLTVVHFSHTRCNKSGIVGHVGSDNYPSDIGGENCEREVRWQLLHSTPHDPASSMATCANDKSWGTDYHKTAANNSESRVSCRDVSITSLWTSNVNTGFWCACMIPEVSVLSGNKVYADYNQHTRIA